MPQLTYPQNQPVAFAGMKCDLDADGYVISAAGIDVVPFGCVVAYDRALNRVALARPNVGTIVENAGTYTAGNGIAIVNGVTVTVAYNATKAQTLADLVAAIGALAFVTTCTYVAPNIVITLDPGIRLYQFELNIAGITGNMTVAATVYTMTDAVAGFSLAQAKEYGSSRRAWNDRAVCLITGDVLNAGDTCTPRVNGVAAPLVTYAASEANTLQLIANSVKNIPGVADAVVNAAARTITVTANPGLELIVALPVVDAVLAAVAPLFTPTYNQQADPVAVNETAYLPTETISIMRKGRVWARVDEAIAFGDPVFVRVQPGTTAQRGTLRNDIDGGTCMAVATLRFADASQTAPDGTLVAPVEINLP